MYFTCATNRFKSYILPIFARYTYATRESVKINDSDYKHGFVGLPLII